MLHLLERATSNNLAAIRLLITCPCLIRMMTGEGVPNVSTLIMAFASLGRRVVWYRLNVDIGP